MKAVSCSIIHAVCTQHQHTDLVNRAWNAGQSDACNADDRRPVLREMSMHKHNTKKHAKASKQNGLSSPTLSPFVRSLTIWEQQKKKRKKKKKKHAAGYNAESLPLGLQSPLQRPGRAATPQCQHGPGRLPASSEACPARHYVAFYHSRERGTPLPEKAEGKRGKAACAQGQAHLLSPVVLMKGQVCCQRWQKASAERQQAPKGRHTAIGQGVQWAVG